MNDEIRLGNISACIAGDHRYTDSVSVTYDWKSEGVYVRLYHSGAVGGMDGPGGSYTPHVSRERFLTLTCGPAEIVKAVREMIKCSDIIVHYGKPTKRFCWFADVENTPVRGLSMKACEAALAHVERMCE